MSTPRRQRSSPDGHEAAAVAIKTTDTVHKVAVHAGATAGRSPAWPRAPGMLAPALATMLVVLTTDAVVDAG